MQVFYVNVDGKKYGPFESKNKEKMSKLLRMKGVTVEYALVDKSSLKKAKHKKVKPQNLSLLDGLEDWRPVKKGGWF